MSTIAYQCPSCGAPLAYEADSGKLVCSACGNSYELDLLETDDAASQQGGIQFDMSTQTFDSQEAAQMQAYICKGCGAELMTEETTTATECPYCGSPTILPERINGGVKPEMVIPFTVTKEAAQKQFEDYFKGKILMPNIFLDTRNRISEMRKLYVPYWLFGCKAGGSAAYRAEKTHTYRQGDWEITETEHYHVVRSGVMTFEDVPVDGSEKMDNKITESIEPYDMRAAVPFAPAVLAGAMADHADVSSADCEARARERVETSMESALRDTVNGYSSVTKISSHFHTEDGKVKPVLMPVWLITTQKDDKVYTFAINGQTGQLTCDVPADTKKSWLWGGGTFVCAFALFCAVLYFMECFSDGMIVGAAVAAFFVAFMVYALLLAQLKQAGNAHGAADYIVRNSFELFTRKDTYLHTTQIRNRIEQNTNQGNRG